MIFNSVAFLLFFPLVCILYYATPKRYRYLTLLAAGYFFYGYANLWAIPFLLITTLATYFGGKLLYEGKKAGFFGLILPLLILAYFKYVPVIISYLNNVQNNGQVPTDDSLGLSLIGSGILLPLGISFYTFQSLTYLLGCNKKTVSPSKNILKYALFVSFFPTILAGPIERAENLLPQFDAPADFDRDRTKEGLMYMLWGYFLKMVIVARLEILTDYVYSDASFEGLPVIIAMLAYSILIYGDFAGYSFIATGCAKIMGFTLSANFRQPYLASSVADFWRRWHISLTSWFRDYVYIPLGGNRRGQVRKCINVMIVFILSGIWHGAGYTFIIWGALNGLYQVASQIFRRNKSTDIGVHRRRLRIVGTFILITITWVFFRSESLTEAWAIFGRIFSDDVFAQLFNGTIFNLGLGVKNMVIVLFAVAILAFFDICCERKKCSITSVIFELKTPLRWCVYLCLAGLILISCNLNTTEFLYMAF